MKFARKYWFVRAIRTNNGPTKTRRNTRLTAHRQRVNCRQSVRGRRRRWLLSTRPRRRRRRWGQKNGRPPGRGRLRRWTDAPRIHTHTHCRDAAASVLRVFFSFFCYCYNILLRVSGVRPHHVPEDLIRTSVKKIHFIRYCVYQRRRSTVIFFSFLKLCPRASSNSTGTGRPRPPCTAITSCRTNI